MTDGEFTLSERVALRQFLQGVKVFRKLAPNVGIQVVDVFLEVALNEELSGNSIMKKAHITQSSCSRNLRALSDTNRKGQPGLNLVETEADEFHQRRKLSRLTPEGVAFAKVLARVLI